MQARLFFACSRVHRVHRESPHQFEFKSFYLEVNLVI